MRQINYFIHNPFKIVSGADIENSLFLPTSSDSKMAETEFDYV